MLIGHNSSVLAAPGIGTGAVGRFCRRGAGFAGGAWFARKAGLTGYARIPGRAGLTRLTGLAWLSLRTRLSLRTSHARLARLARRAGRVAACG